MLIQYDISLMNKFGILSYLSFVFEKEEDIEAKLKKYFDKHSIVSYCIVDSREVKECFPINIEKIYNN